ncbi:hypothetical protein J2I47_09100 [Fibrella sp. HMF5335]|uniref:Uncharacterized protein n=1 Tax=Fibrella rubiginis TaxID=2817060 RepID=A0A939K2V0_9BACT|nr:hypothetical protein [Fibrella rubiginis]MBO0936699.1 hypothetical protein [Fibrella rubiginis]
MLPPITHWPVNWADGMKITRDHLLATDDATRELARDTAGSLLSGLDYGLLPAAAGQESPLRITCDGQSVVVSVCRAITPGGARIELSTDPADALHLPLSPVREAWSKLGQTVGYVIVEANPFNPQPHGQPDPVEEPLRYPFVWPELRLNAVPTGSLHTSLAAAYHLPVGKLLLANGVFSLDKEYLPPCRMVGVLADYRNYYHSLREHLSGLINYATIVLVRVRTNARSGQPNALATSIGYVAEACLYSLGDQLDAFQLRGLHESPVGLVAVGKRLARTLQIAIQSTPDREREAMFNYIKNWTPITPVQWETAIQEMLDTPYEHADCHPVLASFFRLDECLIKLFTKLSDLNYLEKSKDEFFVEKQETPLPRPAPAAKTGFWSR